MTTLDPKHQMMGQAAAKDIGRMIEGNGYRIEQARVSRQEVTVYKLPGKLAIGIRPNITKTQARGRNPQGQVLGSDGEIAAQVSMLGLELLRSPGVQDDILRAADANLGKKELNIELKSAQKDFSVITACPKCAGSGAMSCGSCGASGSVSCQSCQGQGMMSCQNCYGSGQAQQSDGSRLSCIKCHGGGRIACHVCQGSKRVNCPACGGRRKLGCSECAESGFWTANQHVTFNIEGGFDLEWLEIPADIQKIIKNIGMENFLAQKYAEVMRGNPMQSDQRLLVPYTLSFPVAKVEFSLEGKLYPAVIIGPQGKILEIEPLLDTAIKPGINALYKLSKGPMAFQALVDQACKYRLIRGVISGLLQKSKRKVYEELIAEYPQVLSDKYARAVIKYADTALLLIGNAPKRKGLIAGSAASFGIAAVYYMTGLRGFVLDLLQQNNLGRHILMADILCWMAGYVASLYFIRFMAGKALQKLLPANTAQISLKSLPAAGIEGLWALLTTLIASLIAAFLAGSQPSWMTAVFTGS